MGLFILFMLRVLAVIGIHEEDDDIDGMDMVAYSGEVLRTTKKKCDVCGVGDVIKEARKNTELLVYGKTGIKKVKQEE